MSGGDSKNLRNLKNYCDPDTDYGFLQVSYGRLLLLYEGAERLLLSLQLAYHSAGVAVGFAKGFDVPRERDRRYPFPLPCSGVLRHFLD